MEKWLLMNIMWINVYTQKYEGEKLNPERIQKDYQKSERSVKIRKIPNPGAETASLSFLPKEGGEVKIPKLFFQHIYIFA